jgi:aspartate/methionine/tyrosine aminotransferase
VYRQRRDAMADALEQAGWPVQRPSMALYLWLALPPQAQQLDSERFCAELLQATGVALTPGQGFGPSGAGRARLALVHPEADLLAGAERIAGWLAGL